MARCCNMPVGRLNQIIKIERLTRTRDDLGGATEEWTADPTEGVWANIRLLSGTERWEAQRIHQGNMYRITIRWRGDANGAAYYSSADRVIWNEREWAILAVLMPDFDRRYLQLEVIEGRAT